MTNVKAFSFVLYLDRHFVGLTAAGNMDVFSTILMISVKDGVCQGFPQHDFNVTHAFRNTAAISQQEHKFVHEGRNRSHFAWQGALQSDVRAAVIVRCRHSETISNDRNRTSL